ncbi:hypothetical protein XarbCFBP8138_17105 [Xanthomonas arboricola]|nr:hypothetical protein XarbCFBP8138_17105 [Xanthomonas arboricola]
MSAYCLRELQIITVLTLTDKCSRPTNITSLFQPPIKQLFNKFFSLSGLHTEAVDASINLFIFASCINPGSEMCYGFESVRFT